MGRGKGEKRRKGPGNKKHKWQVENRQGEVKKNIGSVEVEELICTTHGHELMTANEGARGDARWRGIQGSKKMRQL